jgi:predicted acetyltransferase
MPSMSEITVIDKPQANGLGRFAWRRTFQRQICLYSSMATAIFLP